MPILQSLLNDVVPGGPLASANLTMIPLHWVLPRSNGVEYELASAAFASGKLQVTEVSEAGVVAELLAVTLSDVPILLIDGEELIGAKQNRILNTDVLLRPHAKKKIPVSCVEQGRWRHDRVDFASGGRAPSALRARKSRSVSDSLRREDSARSDQGAVWDDVAALHACMGTSSATSAMADAYEQRQGELTTIARDLVCPADAVGVIVLINGRFVALDLFDRTETLAGLWPRLIVGYAVDALAAGKAEVSPDDKVDADALLDHAEQLTAEVFPGVDLGEEWRFEGGKLVGSALVAEGVALHLSVFPGDSESMRMRSDHGTIESPNRRSARRRTTN